MNFTTNYFMDIHYHNELQNYNFLIKSTNVNVSFKARNGDYTLLFLIPTIHKL